MSDYKLPLDQQNNKNKNKNLVFDNDPTIGSLIMQGDLSFAVDLGSLIKQIVKS